MLQQQVGVVAFDSREGIEANEPQGEVYAVFNLCSSSSNNSSNSSSKSPAVSTRDRKQSHCREEALNAERNQTRDRLPPINTL